MEGLLERRPLNTKPKEMLSQLKRRLRKAKPRGMLFSRPLRVMFWPILITTNPSSNLPSAC
ncbi:hypothetical protein MtrunA17_Chr6g0462271 [Medicago truncatula]|uniref:Uncharacterized protein n=1 Tax=Medicago truncatula TaxID=3880 RepID=A0A396HC19_MEDTR|nr:hypothetical protein MtrunA17_Chr6g0462271 [Medicago truncatula]